MIERVLSFGRCLVPLLVLSFVMGGVALPARIALAGDTDGPSGPPTVTNPGCPNDSHGPCTDPHTYTGGGVGNGICGRCGNKVYTYTGGSCSGTNGGDPDCRNYTVPATATYNFVSTPVGSLTYAACLAVYVACLTADGALAAGVCGGACIVGGVFTLGASCVACLAAAGAGAAACTCAYDECKEDCNYTGVTWAGSASACF